MSAKPMECVECGKQTFYDYFWDQGKRQVPFFCTHSSCKLREDKLGRRSKQCLELMERVASMINSPNMDKWKSHSNNIAFIKRVGRETKNGN